MASVTAETLAAGGASEVGGPGPGPEEGESALSGLSEGSSDGEDGEDDGDISLSAQRTDDDTAELYSPEGDFFGDAEFLLTGFTEEEELWHTAVLTDANGSMAASPEALSKSNKRARYVVYPRRMRQPDFEVALSGVSFVTEWWVEDCAFYKRLLAIQPDHITTMPFAAIPIAEFAGLNIVTAGMDERERERWISLIELVGANYDTKISREADMLLSPDVTLCAKYWYAVENNIPVLRSTWFVECMEKGAVVDYGQHLLESLGRHGARRPADRTRTPRKKASAKSTLSEEPQFANLEWVVRKDDATYVAPAFRKRRNSLSPGDALTLMREAEERTRDAKRQKKAAARRAKALAGRTEEEVFEADRLTRANPEHEKLPWIVPVPGAEMVWK